MIEKIIYLFFIIVIFRKDIERSRKILRGPKFYFKNFIRPQNIFNCLAGQAR